MLAGAPGTATTWFCIDVLTLKVDTEHTYIYNIKGLILRQEVGKLLWLKDMRNCTSVLTLHLPSVYRRSHYDLYNISTLRVVELTFYKLCFLSYPLNNLLAHYKDLLCLQKLHLWQMIYDNKHPSGGIHVYCCLHVKNIKWSSAVFSSWCQASPDRKWTYYDHLTKLKLTMPSISLVLWPNEHL